MYLNCCESVLNQIKVAVQTIVGIVDTFEDTDLLYRPTENKFSVGELLGHLATICEADWRISNEASEQEMHEFYSRVSYSDLNSIRRGILENYKSLERKYVNLTKEELDEKTTSYWGVTYSRYEWLLEILTHLIHHRGQLHAMLVHCADKDFGVMLFE